MSPRDLTPPIGEPLTARVAYFEQRYQGSRELWGYSGRAAELLRHEWVAERIAALEPASVLDLGCSQGQITARLRATGRTTIGMDLSHTALTRARAVLARDDGRPPVPLLCGDVTDMPIAAAAFDVVVASDGPRSWDLSREQRDAAYREIHRILRPGGHALFTEHTRAAQFAGFVDEIAASPLDVVWVGYLYDRPWYQFESWLRAILEWRIGRALRRNLAIARLLRRVGALIGPRASRHVCVLARRG